MAKNSASVLIVGSMGAGKSYFAQYLILKLNQKFKVIIDPSSEYEIPGFAIVELNPWNYKDTLKSFPEILKKYHYVIVQFDYLSLEDQKKIVDYLAALMFNIKNVIFMIDEAHLYVGKTKPAKNAVNLATMGRKYGISTLYVTQRPQQLDTTVRSMTWYKIAFRVNDQRDVEALRGYLKNVDILTTLPRRWFLYRNAEGDTFLSTTEGLKLPHLG